MKLTLTRIDGLKCPPGKRDMLVFDDEQRGLGVRVTAGGGKTYLAQYTADGRKHRIPLGSCDALSLAKAREAVRSIAGDVAKGIDPAGERRRKAAHKGFTVSALLGDWQSLHLAGKRPRYAREAVRALRNAFAPYLDMPAADLGRAIIVKTLDALSRKGSAAMAARTAAYGKAAAAHSRSTRLSTCRWHRRRGAIACYPMTSL